VRGLWRLGSITLAVIGSGLFAAACGSVQQAVTAPLAALSATDVVVEQNLQTVQQYPSGGLTSVSLVSGPSLNYHQVSESRSTGLLVLASYNQLDRHCLGTVTITTGGSTVLGESSPGTYDFWQLHGTAAQCDAASFAVYPRVPPGWGSGDPASGWPTA
jgi:hypothetical protein